MVNETVRRALLPGGLAISVVGLFLAAWAYTGTRTVDITYFYVAVTGLVFLVTGVLTAAYGRAMAPRGRAARKGATPAAAGAKAAAAAPRPDADKGPTVSLMVRIKGLGKKPGPVERFTLQCPDCRTVFNAEGHRPIKAECPACKLQAPIP